MKLTRVALLSMGLSTAVWATTQTNPPSIMYGPTSTAPSLQLPVVGSDAWLTNNWFNVNNYPKLQFGPISGKYWTAFGKRLGVRSEYLVQKDLTAARSSYLAGHSEQAVADMLKAALLLQDDAKLAKPAVQVELRGNAIVLEHSAEMIADGHTKSISQLDGVFREARQAARDFDNAHFGGV